jgi:lipopolysaccharide export system protein LptA
MNKHGGIAMKRILVIAGLILLLALAVVSGMFPNAYATGTKDKDFINTKWKISPHEIERANKASLVKPKVIGPLPDGIDPKKITQWATESKKEQAPARNTENNQKSAQNKAIDKNKGLAFFDKTKPVNIVSDTIEGFDKEKYVVFKGSVTARQEDLLISADTIEAYMSKDTNEIKKAVAIGNVKIVKQDRTATCQEALFENAKGEITLKGNVIVYQGRDKLSGDVIIYYVNTDKVVVQADKGKGARITVRPK